ncbi:MAG: I78 family peptidase inhibitor [Pseudomonadota bacterium]|nr:I78 family peptidase inhibitor [Pseudomonadota bacterium]
MKYAICLPALLLAACATTPAPVVPIVAEPAQPAGTCLGDSLASFIGQPRSEALGARMLRQTGATKIRWVAKGMMVTMDYRDDRLTVYLDAANRIERASCG